MLTSEDGIHDFESAKREKILTKASPDRHLNGANVDESPASQETPRFPPNLMLNIGTRRVSTVFLVLVVFIGILLQTGVIVFAGFTAYHQNFAASLPGDETGKEQHGDGSSNTYRMAPKYAFPTMSAGTVTMGLGMFFCAWIINRSTAEEVWNLAVSDDGRSPD